METRQAVEGNGARQQRSRSCSWRKGGEVVVASCLCFRMEPLLLETQSSWGDADDVERLPCSHRLVAGLHFYVKVLYLCRGRREHQRADISTIVLWGRDDLVNMSSFITGR